MIPFLDVTADDLARLRPDEAVSLFRSMLWADASIYNVRIDAPSAVNAPDGGVDATVAVPGGAPPPSGPSVLLPGLACYQIKTGRSISIGNKKDRRRLLYGPAGSTELSPRVKECLDAGGTLVFVLFGSDTPSRADAEGLLRRDLPEGPAYDNARIEVWLQNELIGHLGRHPALRRMLRGGGHESYLTHGGWGAAGDMGGMFVQGESHAAFIGEMRRGLRAAGGTRVDMRLVGPPGSGKTRLAHEITKASDLAPLVLYFENPAPLEDNRILNALAEGEREHAILVVDECDARERERIVNRVSGAGGRVRLVTIFNKDDDGDALIIPELGEPEIKRIIQGYGAPVDEAKVAALASLCAPSPRYAHRLAGRMLSDPDGLFRRPLDPAWLHRNYIAGALDVEGAEYADREAVLTWFGLFEMVGHDPPYEAESEFLAQYAEMHDGIAPGRFDRIVGDLRDLKILHGYKTLYVAPPMLHLWLWGEWWRVHGRRLDLAAFLSGDGTASGRPMPARLFEWFAQMLASASDLPEAAGVAGGMLAAGGLLGSGGDGHMLESSPGARLFRSAAMANPEAALALLSRTVATWGDARLAAFRAGRRDIVQATVEIARRSKDVGAAARILLRLAANENDGTASSATSALARLFAPPPGEPAASPARQDELHALLAVMLADPDGRVRRLALMACDEALESADFARIDPDGGRILPGKLAPPGGERVRGYRKVLAMLLGCIGAMPPVEGQEAARIVLERAAELPRLAGLSGDAAGALRRLHDQKAIGDEALLEGALAAIRAGAGGAGGAGGMDQEAAAAWRGLVERVYDGSDYGSRMRRFVGMNIAADIEPRGAGAGEGQSERDEQVKRLAAETIRRGGLPAGAAEWIFRPGAHGAAPFGGELGRQDLGFALLGHLVEAASDAMASPPPAAGRPRPAGPARPDVLLGSYLAHAFERDPNLWEETMDSLAGDPRLAPLVPQITWRSGLSDRAWDRVAGLCRRGIVPKSGIAIFALGGRPCRMSDGAFAEAVSIMRDSPTASDTRGALALLAGRCRCAGRRLGVPLDTLHAVVADDLFLSGEGGGEEQGMLTGAMWEAVARRLVEDDPDRIPALAGALFDAMEHGVGVLDAAGGRGAWPVLDLMAATAPGPVWESASGRIALPPDARSRRILAWLGGSTARPAGQRRGAPAPLDVVPLAAHVVGKEGQGVRESPAPLDVVPLDAVWDWVDADRGARAVCLAQHAPRAMGREQRCFARDLLSRYGADGGVRAAMRRRFSPDEWTGPEADHLAVEIGRYERHLRGENDPNVRVWLEEMIGEMRARLGPARASDERLP